MDIQLAFNTLTAETLGEHASLWAIRLAMILLVIGLAMLSRGMSSTSRVLVSIWLLGALCAAAHSVGALWTFHRGSHAEALRSTAEQTKEFLGVAVGAGLYFNYVFVTVWLADALWRILAPECYRSLVWWYHWSVIGFLVFIAVNGAIVFKSGSIRWIGIACVIGLVTSWAQLHLQQSRRMKGIDRR